MLKYKALEEDQDQIATGITSAFQNFMSARNQVIEQQQKAQTFELEKLKTLAGIENQQKTLQVNLAEKGLKFADDGTITQDPNTETLLQKVERESKEAAIAQKDRALGIKEQEVAGKNRPGALDEILKQGGGQGTTRDQLLTDARTKAEAAYPGYTIGFDSTGKVALKKKSEAQSDEKREAGEAAAQRIKSGESTAAEETKKLRTQFPDISWNTLDNLTQLEKDYKPELAKAKQEKIKTEKNLRAEAIRQIKAGGFKPTEANIKAGIAQLKGE
jgi:hypothetical protein